MWMQDLGVITQSTEEHVLKAMVGRTLTGYVCFFGDGLYCGASSDSVIQDCGVLRFVSSRGIRALADGGFYECQRIITPHAKTHIWPSLQANKPISDYVREADVKLAYNESLSHFRARVENIFSRSCTGRWLAFRNWTKFSDSLLYYSFAYRLIIHNLEVYLRQEWGGKYSPFTPERVRILECKVKEHKAQSSRYSNPLMQKKRGRSDEELKQTNLDRFIVYDKNCAEITASSDSLQQTILESDPIYELPLLNFPLPLPGSLFK